MVKLYVQKQQKQVESDLLTTPQHHSINTVNQWTIEQYFLLRSKVLIWNLHILHILSSKSDLKP